MTDIGSKYIKARVIEYINGKPAWAIVNIKSNTEIACIAWYPLWKRYCMVTDTPVVLDVGCMKSVIDFISEVTL